MLSQGLINLKIEPEVSQIDTNQRIEIVNGISVPALIVRRAATTVELRDGQSFAIGGLLQNNSQNQVEQLPWVGSMPVLGALFTSKSYQKNETDLVIIVTPRLVRPARPGEVLRTPTDKTRAAERRRLLRPEQERSRARQERARKGASQPSQPQRSPFR